MFGWKAKYLALEAARDAEIAGLCRQLHDAEQNYADAQATIVDEQNHSDTLRHEQRVIGASLNEVLKERDEARAALIDIANMETGACANIGRRMAGRARQALPGGGPAIRLVAAAGVA